MSETKKTLIEEGTEFKGTLTSSCPIVVMGRVEGDMKGPSVEVTETGVLSGKAKVTELRSRGELAGEFDADVVELSGRVRDKSVIRAQSLEVSLSREGGRIEMVFGDCELAVGEAPDKARAVREATAKPKEAKDAKAAPAPEAAGGGEVSAEADMSASARLRRGKPADAASQPESA
ncbi:MAG TPA: polymer-forming cytoskeletal protein [Polyangia bacterium]|nr:polymer-forming cytoskeletal protein [Polyangia bacterium]